MDRQLDSSTTKRKRKKTILLGITIVALASVVLVIVSLNRPGVQRPQEPSKPYPYYSEDIAFQNLKASVSLAGTLTLPSRDGTYPAVVLISGSGPQNRDYEFAGHKPFLVLADYLTKNGIAVLRYDDRGFGKSTGNFADATSMDFSYDAESAVGYLMTRKEIQKNKVGLIGHSDGAMVAPMVGARSNEISFMVLLAGPGVACAKLLLDRQELLERRMGFSDTVIRKSRRHSEQIIQIIVNTEDSETTKSRLTDFSKKHDDDIPDYAIPRGMTKDEYISKHIEMLSTPWFKYFFTYDPASTLRKVKCPVLALNGEKDVQVPSKDNLEGIRKALSDGGNSNIIIREIPGLNHVFQECVTGMPDEYGVIEQTFSPIVLAEIHHWILQQVE